MNSSKDMQNKWEQSSVASESSDDGMSTESPHTQTQRSESTKEEPLTLRETVAVNRSKVLVYIAIVLAACAVGFLTYYFTSSEERADFQRSVSTVVVHEVLVRLGLHRDWASHISLFRSSLPLLMRLSTTPTTTLSISWGNFKFWLHPWLRWVTAGTFPGRTLRCHTLISEPRRQKSFLGST